MSNTLDAVNVKTSFKMYVYASTARSTFNNCLHKTIFCAMGVYFILKKGPHIEDLTASIGLQYKTKHLIFGQKSKGTCILLFTLSIGC